MDTRRCDGCGKDRPRSWFGEHETCCECRFRDYCRQRREARLAALSADAGEPVRRRRRRRRTEREAPPAILRCGSCRHPKPRQIFRRPDGGWYTECQVCRLITDYRERQRQEQEKSNVVPFKRLEDIPIRAKEQNRPEKYTIQCSRCGERRNPEVVAVVGTICQHCWRPDEVQAAWREHLHWNRNWTGAPPPGLKGRA